MYDDRFLLWFFMSIFYCLWTNSHWFYERVLHAIKVRSFPSFIDSLNMHGLFEWYDYDFTIVLIVYHLIFGIHWFANQLSLLPQLISRNLYLRFREVLPYGAFSIGNLTLGLRLGFQRHIFPNKESFFRVLFLILFSLLEINKNKWQL